MIQTIPDDILYYILPFLTSKDILNLKFTSSDFNSNHTMSSTLTKKVAKTKLDQFLLSHDFFGRENIIYNVNFYPISNSIPRVFRTRKNNFVNDGYDDLFIEESDDIDLNMLNGSVYSIIRYKNEIIVGHMLYEAIVSHYSTNNLQ